MPVQFFMVIVITAVSLHYSVALSLQAYNYIRQKLLSREF